MNLSAGEYTLKLTTVTDENHRVSTNQSRITVKPLGDDGNSRREGGSGLHQNMTSSGKATSNKKTSKKPTKAGLAKHETANPIIVLVMVLATVGFVQLRRFR